MSCIFFEATALKSQKKKWVGWGEDALVSPSNMLNQIPFLFCLICTLPYVKLVFLYVFSYVLEAHATAPSHKPSSLQKGW